MNAWRERLEGLASAGEEVARTEWVPVTRSEADVFDRLVTCRGVDFGRRRPGPAREEPVSRLFLLALLSKFSSEAGAPVATDAEVTMLNYGYDDVEWHRDVYGGTMVRDEIRFAGIEPRQPDQYLLRHEHRLLTRECEEPAMTATSLGLAILL